MIQLIKYEYCEKCPYFEVEQQTMKFCEDVIIHTLECKHSDKCDNIKEYLERKDEH